MVEEELLSKLINLIEYIIPKYHEYEYDPEDFRMN